MPERDLHTHPLALLIVEDDATFGEALATYFGRDRRIDVVGVESHLEGAVECARRRAAEVALVDVLLANGDDGFDVVRALRDARPSLVALIMTGSERDDVASAAASAGALRTLKKMEVAHRGRHAVVEAYEVAAAASRQS